jgi:hypothetical protein
VIGAPSSTVSAIIPEITGIMAQTQKAPSPGPGHLSTGRGRRKLDPMMRLWLRWPALGKRGSKMADTPARTFVPGKDPAFGVDYEASVAEGIPEFYGAKINLFYSSREFRIAIGNAYAHRQADGELVLESRYRVAVFIPVATARDLYRQLGPALKAAEAEEGDDEPADDSNGGAVD